jgi:hypothetical protein
LGSRRVADGFPQRPALRSARRVERHRVGVELSDAHIKAVNTDPGGCMRTPACGYPPKTLDEVYGKVLWGKAFIVDGEYEVVPGVKIHPAFRPHTPRARSRSKFRPASANACSARMRTRRGKAFAIG